MLRLLTLLLAIGSVFLWKEDLENLRSAHILTLFLMVANAFFVEFVIRRNVLSKDLSGWFVRMLFLFSCAVFPPLHDLWEGQLVMTINLFIIYLIDKTHENGKIERNATVIALIVCLSTLLMPQQLVMLLFLLAAFNLSGYLTLKSFLAMVIACAVFSFYYFCIVYFLGMSEDIIFKTWETGTLMWDTFPQHFFIGIAALFSLLFIMQLITYSDLKYEIMKKKQSVYIFWNFSIFSLLSTIYINNEPFALSSFVLPVVATVSHFMSVKMSIFKFLLTLIVIALLATLTLLENYQFNIFRL